MSGTWLFQSVKFTTGLELLQPAPIFALSTLLHKRKNKYD